MSGDVRLVKAVDGGAEPRPSLKRSLGDTVCADEAAVLIAVKLAVPASSQLKSAAPSRRPRSKCVSKSVIVLDCEILCCGICPVDWLNSGTGGRGGRKPTVLEGAEFE